MIWYSMRASFKVKTPIYVKKRDHIILAIHLESDADVLAVGDVVTSNATKCRYLLTEIGHIASEAFQKKIRCIIVKQLSGKKCDVKKNDLFLFDKSRTIKLK